MGSVGKVSGTSGMSVASAREYQSTLLEMAKSWGAILPPTIKSEDVVNFVGILSKDYLQPQYPDIDPNILTDDLLDAMTKELNNQGKVISATNNFIVTQNPNDDYYSVTATDASKAQNKTSQPDADYGKYVERTFKVVSNPDGSAMLYTTNQKTGRVTSEYFRYAKDARSEAGRQRYKEKQSAIEKMNKK